ncbi:MAG: dimethyl sulfoxide reductase anchor subunit family protein [Hyphomicrobiaceae bacterium]
MHPAYSVLFFTTLSGAGYGLLIWLAVLALLDRVPADWSLGVAGFGLAFALIVIGLLCSTAHLGHPERAWRAFSQWRTSWLSREGVAAMATFVPSGLFAIGWVMFGTHDHIFAVMAALTILAALATVYCTGMIYQSLPTIRAWSQTLVSPIYVVLGLATGGTLAALILALFGKVPSGLIQIVIAINLLAATLKLAYWWRIDAKGPRHTAGAATGLGNLGTVRPLDPPHTQANFVMREMGFQVARKHASKLRRVALIAGFLLPALLLVVALLTAPSVAVVALLLAVVATAIGVFAERWLFFAEAQHVVTLYYGAQEA